MYKPSFFVPHRVLDEKHKNIQYLSIAYFLTKKHSEKRKGISTL